MSKLWDLLLPLALQALLLLFISRLLFAVVFGAVADRRGKGLWLGLLRLPGNIIHEYSHCLGFWLGGYRVARILICIFDPQGRGSCQPGRPWSPLTLPWLAMGMAALMPLIVGSVLLVLAGQHLEVLSVSPEASRERLLTLILTEAGALLRGLDWHRWQTYLFLYLALSIGAELAPSGTDLRYGVPALAGLLAGTWLFFFAAARAPGLSALEADAVRVLAGSAAWLSQTWTATLVLTTAAAAVLLLPGLLIRAFRH